MTKNQFFTSRVHFWTKYEFFNFPTKIRLRPQGTIFGPILVDILNLQFFDLQGPFLLENFIYHFSTKNRFETSRHHFLVNFGRQIELSIFWPKINFLNLQDPFLVEKLSFHFSTKNRFETSRGHFLLKNWTYFFTKNRFLTSTVYFLSRNWIFYFSTKNRFETSRDHSLTYFGRKIELSSFWPKIDFWPPGSIFGRKLSFINFSTKNRFETSKDHFWANSGRKIELPIFWQKIVFWSPGSRKICIFRFENSRDHFLANFDRKIELSIFRPKIDFWPPGPFLVEFCFFLYFLDQKSIETSRDHFLVEKLNVRFLDQKSILDFQGPFLVEN